MRKISPPPGMDTWTVQNARRNDFKRGDWKKYRVKERKMKEIREHKKNQKGTKEVRVKICE
jgi:hypothetical protein